MALPTMIDLVRGFVDRRGIRRGNRFKEREVRNAIRTVLRDEALTGGIFEIIKAQRDY